MIGVLITARTGSSRLERKHLVLAERKPLIWWLCARLEREFGPELANGSVKIVIATSEKPENKVFRSAAEGLHTEVFFGSDNKIPLRHLQCADHYGFSHIIAVDGDDILCSSRGARRLFESMQDHSDGELFEASGLPLGMNPSGYSTGFLRKSIEASKDPRLETGWGRIFVNPRKVEIKLGEHDVRGPLRFTLDYPEDAQFFQSVIEALKQSTLSVGDEELIQLVMDKEYYKINAHLRDAYWANFYAEKEKETRS